MGSTIGDSSGQSAVRCAYSATAIDPHAIAAPTRANAPLSSISPASMPSTAARIALTSGMGIFADSRIGFSGAAPTRCITLIPASGRPAMRRVITTRFNGRVRRMDSRAVDVRELLARGYVANKHTHAYTRGFAYAATVAAAISDYGPFSPRVLIHPVM